MTYNVNRKTRTLLVDDDPSMIRLLTTILNREFGDDLEIIALVDPNEARQWLGQNAADIMITDLEMPQISGLELLAAAKRRDACTQVFFITGHSTLDALVEALELGATDYLLKPVDPKILTQLVQDARTRLERWREALVGTLAARHAASQAAAETVAGPTS